LFHKQNFTLQSLRFNEKKEQVATEFTERMRKNYLENSVTFVFSVANPLKTKLPPKMEGS